MVLRIFVFLSLLLLLTASCAKLPERSPEVQGDVAIVAMASADTIPASWGHLVSVSNIDDIFQLWFEDATGTLRVAFYDVRANTLQAEGRRFPRSQEVMR